MVPKKGNQQRLIRVLDEASGLALELRGRLVRGGEIFLDGQFVVGWHSVEDLGQSLAIIVTCF